MTGSAQSNGHLTEQRPSLKNAEIIFFIGAPGTGKGTQCTRLAEELGFVHISVGDLLRDREKHPFSSPLLKALIRSRTVYRTPMPNHFYVGLLRDELVKNMAHGKSQFLVDGFPRNIKQLWLLEQASTQLKATLHFFCPLEISRLRVANRALTSGRYNDNAEVFEERHRKFLKEGVDVFFRRMSELECHEIETNRRSDEVYQSVRTIVKFDETKEILLAPYRDQDKPVLTPHADQTREGGPPRRTGYHLTDEESAKYLDCNWRIRILNCGRPLFHNADERPFAVCDYYTVNEEELISADRAFREYFGEIYYMQYNERQQWYWISGQKPDEIQLFVNYDSECRQGLACMPHSSFLNNSPGPNVKPRQSLETAIIVITKKNEV